MKRLRHPINAIREPFGKAGLIVACLALVFAMAGGALAAKGALTGKQKKEVEKIAKKYAGKPGKPGAAGATGPAGPTGPAGAAGVGKNGKEGPEGHEGSPWVAGGVLPPGQTETGAWGVGPLFMKEGETARVPISFTIPLVAPLDESHALAVAKTGNGSTCPGSAESPAAEPGYLCVYQNFGETTNDSPKLINPGVESIFDPALAGAGTTGAMLFLTAPNTQPEITLFGWGTWAVTAAP